MRKRSGRWIPLAEILVILIVYPALALAEEPTYFSSPVQVDDTGVPNSAQWYPTLSVDDNDVIYATWQDYRNGNWDVYLTSSTDSGETFADDVRVHEVDSALSAQTHPSVTSSAGGQVAVVWKDDRNDTSAIYLSTSSDGGATFGTDLEVHRAAEDGYLEHPDVAYGPSDTLYVAWQDTEGGSCRVYVATSTDGGMSFSAPVLVDGASTGTQRRPQLGTLSDGTLAVVWEDRRFGSWDIFYAYSDDLGSSFQQVHRIHADPNDAITQTTPSLAIGPNDELAVAWEHGDNASSEVYAAMAPDVNGLFSAGVDVQIDSEAESEARPHVTFARSGDIYVTWTRYSDPDVDLDDPEAPLNVFVARSQDGAQSFSDAIPPSHNEHGQSQRASEMAVLSTDTVFVLWEEYVPQGQPNIYSSRSYDAAQTFVYDVRVDGSGIGSTDALQPSIAVDHNDHVYVAWEDYRLHTPNIYLAKSVDGGKSFGDDIRVDDSGWSEIEDLDPELTTLSDGTVVATWKAFDPLDRRLRIIHSTDGGQTFTGGNWMDQVDDDCLSPAMAVGPADRLYFSCAPFQETYLTLNRTSDMGQTFSAETKVEVGVPLDTSPDIMVDAEQVVYVAWSDSYYLMEKRGDIFVSRSIDGGQTFEMKRRVHPPHSAIDIGPHLAMSEQDTLFATWFRRVDSNDTRPHLSWKSKGDTSFSDPVKVHDDCCLGAGDPRVGFFDSRRLYVVWANSGLFWIATSPDLGRTFYDPVAAQLDAGTSYKLPRFPSSEPDSKGRIHLTVLSDEERVFALHTAGPPVGTLELWATPPKVQANGGAKTTISSTILRDVDGLTPLDGTLVTVSTSLGTIVSEDLHPDEPGIQVGIEDGRVVATLQAGTTTGEATVIAESLDGNAQGQMTVAFVPPVPLLDVWSVAILVGVMGGFLASWSMIRDNLPLRRRLVRIKQKCMGE